MSAAETQAENLHVAGGDHSSARRLPNSNIGVATLVMSFDSIILEWEGWDQKSESEFFPLSCSLRIISVRLPHSTCCAVLVH